MFNAPEAAVVTVPRLELVRETGRQYAKTGAVDAELLALYVQTAGEDADRIALDSQRHLMSHLELAMQLGGQVHKVVSDNIPQTIDEFCRRQHATLLCMGQPSLSLPRLLMRAGSYRYLLTELKKMGVDLVIVS